MVPNREMYVRHISRMQQVRLPYFPMDDHGIRMLTKISVHKTSTVAISTVKKM